MVSSIAFIEYTFFSLEIINAQNIHKNILEILDQNRINIKVTFLYFSTNQLKTQNKNILEISDQNRTNIAVPFLKIFFNQSAKNIK